MTPEEWDAVVRVQLYGTFYCTRPASALMREQRNGRIINISSGSAWAGSFGGTNYAAAKAGVFGFTRGCALELGKYGITVNCIGPGAATRLSLERAAEVKSGGHEDYTLDRAPSEAAPRSPTDPDDVAPVVVYLATDAAANINGQWFNARGGEISLSCVPTPVQHIYKDGRWTLDELLEIMPTTLAVDLENPAPPEQD
jgi:NAD(P)-dependent dehydrogenase (short-subunit alcohol dehydrogenase family)